MKEENHQEPETVAAEMLVAGENALNAAPVVPVRVINKVAPVPKVAAVPKKLQFRW